MKLTLQIQNKNKWLAVPVFDDNEIVESIDRLSPIQRLFHKIHIVCSFGFTNNLTDGEVVALQKLWAECLDEHDMTRDELQRGMKSLLRAGKRKWRIDYMEFYELCRPPLNYQSLFGEALNQMNKRSFGQDRWDNPALYHAYMKIGDFEMKRTTYNQIKQKWKSTLDDCIAARPIMPVPPAELRKALPIIRNKKTAVLGIAAMRKTLAEGRGSSAQI